MKRRMITIVAIAAILILGMVWHKIQQGSAHPRKGEGRCGISSSRPCDHHEFPHHGKISGHSAG